MTEEEKKAKRRKRRGKGSSIITKESVSAVFAVFSLLSFLILCTDKALFGAIGGTVNDFLLGVFGVFAYPVALAIFYVSFMGLIGKRLVRNRKAGACIVFTIIFLALIVHTAMTYTWSLTGYLERCFEAPALQVKPFVTVGGWVGALPVWGLVKLVTRVGTLIIFSILAVLFGYLSYLSIHGKRAPGEPKPKKPKKEKEKKDSPVAIPLTQTAQPVQQQPAYGAVDTKQQPGVTLGNSGNGRVFSPFAGAPQAPQTPAEREAKRKFLFGKTAREQYQDNLIFDPNSHANNRPQGTPYGQPVGVSYTDAYQTSVNQQPQRPEKIVTDFSTPYSGMGTREPATPPPPVSPAPVEPVAPVFDRETQVSPIEDERAPVADSSREDFRLIDNAPRGYEGLREGVSDDFSIRDRGRSGLDIFDEEDDPYSLRDDFSSEDRGRGGFGRETQDSTRDFSRGGREELFSDRDRGGFLSDRGETSAFGTPLQPQRPVQPTPPPEPPKPRIIRPYVQPRLDDFTCTDIVPTHDPETEEEIKRGIIETLEKNRVMGASVVSITHGPTVTRYNVAINIDTSPQKVLGMEDNFQMSLQSSLVNVTPNYDNGTISIEVPNKNRQFVHLGSMLSGDTFVNAKSSSLMFTMGKDVFNAKVYGDLSKMVHLLVAGGTGGGKSVFLGAMIMSLIYKYSPQELRLILIDPKKTEFSLYYNLPHLMINEIITDSKKTVRALNWAESEMNRRYELISQMTKSGKFVQNIDQYNSYVEKENKLPKLVIIIDELADLMLTSERKDIEDRIQSLTQKARAAGIHVVVATQRPSTNVITGVIKTNLTTRIAFSVPTDVDSRVILDHTGAQNLCGLGDMLYFISGMKSPIRVQSPFISNEEAQRIVNFIKENNEAYYDEDATAYINDERGGGESVIDDTDEFDPVYVQALRYVILSNTASISLVQRKCSVGYNKAGKIIDWMDNKGYITPFDGAKARKVLITREDFEQLYGPF